MTKSANRQIGKSANQQSVDTVGHLSFAIPSQWGGGRGGYRHWPLVICLLCSIAVVPLLRSKSPCTHDGALHYFRVTAMRHALQNGILFTRYLPDLAFGYGYPFFNYRAALSYYLALALYLTGLALPAALNMVYVLSIVGSALAAYLFARDLFGPRAGIVAAVAYAYAPYQFLNALLRGNAPESVALPLFPLILWAFRRLALTGHRRWFLVSVVSLSALHLSHVISFFLFTPLLLAYLVVLWLVHRREGHWVATGGAFAMAWGLTAFFWAPALLERGYIQLHMSRVTRNNDFHYNFLALAEIFALPAPVDTSLMNPPMRIHLGLVQAILGGIGLVVGLIRWRDRERRATLAFFALTAVVMLWMSTRASLWLWEHVPLLPFVQFPWRLVGRATLPVAFLASAIAPTRHASRTTFHVSRFTFHVSRALPLVSITLLILAALPYTYPPHGYCPNAPYPTINDVFAYEHRSKLVGVDPEGSYFPAWVKHRPEGSPLEEQYAAGGPISRFDETALPAGASVVEDGYSPNRAQVVVETPAPFRARYLAFYFPGWRVWIDEEPVETTASDPAGLITFDVPAGRHTIIIRFGSTPVRTTFTAISLLSLVALLILTVRYPQASNLKSQIPNPKSQDSSFVIRHLSLSITVIFLLALKLSVVDRLETPFRRPTLQPDNTLPGVEHRLDQPYADGLTLIGYDQDRPGLPADGTLRLDLYWTAHAQPSARYQSVVHLVAPDGLRWSPPDTFRPRGYADYPPSTTWSPGRYALDSHEIETLPGTPPGTYDVVLTVFDRDTLAPLSVLNEQDQPAAPTLTLGQVTLTAPHRPVGPDGLDVHHRLNVVLGPLTLLGADFDRDEAAPGDPILLTTFWRADQQPPENPDLTLHLALLPAGDPTAAPAAQFDLPPTGLWHPTSAWQPGNVWRGQHFLHLPANLDSGDYTWHLTLLPTSSSTRLPSPLTLTAPSRTFTPPSFPPNGGDERGGVDVTLGDLVTLSGFDVGVEMARPGETLTVTLVWRAEVETRTSYHVFLHLIGPGGELVAQSDGVPADWSRPTTGWLPGEYVTDTRVLTLPADAPAGDYVLSAGLYVPGGERLTTPDGTDAIHLTTIAVESDYSSRPDRFRKTCQVCPSDHDRGTNTVQIQ